MFVSEHHKKAVKASLAWLVGTQGHTPRYAALIVQYGQERLMLQAGDMSSLDAKERYAHGIRKKDERASNQLWSSFTEATQSLVNQIAASEAMLQTDGFYAA